MEHFGSALLECDVDSAMRAKLYNNIGVTHTLLSWDLDLANLYFGIALATAEITEEDHMTIAENMAHTLPHSPLNIFRSLLLDDLDLGWPPLSTRNLS